MSVSRGTPGTVLRTARDIDNVVFGSDGGTVVVAQDASDGRVLMVAHADREALLKTLETGEMWYRSRTRGLWHKGATSGHVQRVVELRLDCDADAVLALVHPAGPACHTGEISCFGAYAPDVIARLDAIIALRAAEGSAATSYTARLLRDRNVRLKKLGEEATELAVACADEDGARAADEAADVLYHTAVALHATGSTLGAARRVLMARAR